MGDLSSVVGFLLWVFVQVCEAVVGVVLAEYWRALRDGSWGVIELDCVSAWVVCVGVSCLALGWDFSEVGEYFWVYGWYVLAKLGCMHGRGRS